MDNLDRRLHELGAHWDAPPTPDVVTGVLAGANARNRRAPRRVLIALAVTLVMLGTVAAIAPARDAVLDFFHIGGVRITTTPAPTPPSRSGSLGGVTDLDAAQDQAPFALRRPTVPNRAPDRVLVQRPPRDGAYAFVWDSAPDVAIGQLVVTQFRGQLIAEKSIDPAVTTVEHVEIDGSDGVWLSGGPHTIGYIDTDQQFRVDTLRRVGDVLVWERAGVTYRIEGARSLDAARRVAASLR